MNVYTADRQPLMLPPGHRFPGTKYERLRLRLEAMEGVRLQQAEPASDGELALVHTPGYVEAVSRGTLAAAEQRAIGFPWSEAMVERARRSVGATVAASRAARNEGVAANLAGGTHHASAARGAGYCVFNDVAVAARLAQAEALRRGERLRVVVIDLDVHQGDGTAAIFSGDASVFTLSLHGEKNFPFRKATSSLDVALPDACADVAYLEALGAALDAIGSEHARAPFGLAFYLAGADPHENDRLGRLALTTQGMAERDRRVFDALFEWRVPAALAMAGGYGRDLEVTVSIQEATFAGAVAHERRWKNARR